MIDVRELRIGNCVNISNKEYHPKLTDNKTILKVAGISMHTKGYSIELNTTDVTKQDVSPFISQFIKYIKPIKITEEILLKCGFQLSYDDDIENHVFNINGDNSFILSPSWADNEINELIIIYYNNHIEVDIKYFHKLQNIYFTLKGKELPINI